jgi:3-hydroxyacyl-CoA dehydrogenase
MCGFRLEPEATLTNRRFTTSCGYARETREYARFRCSVIPFGGMSQLVRYEVRDGVAVITADNPPVNALGAGVPEAISEAVGRACHDAAADAIVLIGAGTTFIAGADISVFRQLKTRQQSIERSQAVHRRLTQLEDAAKPLVAAIHGHALGGGLEFAMACHYRVAAATARVGQPEVNLGIIPGAGGTQRLPRLCGVSLALEMCTDGKPVAANRAREGGIVDAVIDGDLLEGAMAFATARAASGERRRSRDLQDKIADRESGLAACQATRAALATTAGGARAPFAAVDAIEACLTMDFAAGSQREIELFADCVLSTESKAMRHLFFAEREAARIPDVPKDTPTLAIRRAAIVGAGTMGGGIAMAYANAGIPVLLKDVDQAALDRGMSTIRRNYESTMAKRKITAEAMARTLALMTPTTSYDGFGEVDIVVEAVFENMDLKKTTFAAIAAVTRPDAILASNTSTLDIDELAEASGRPGQVVGHHFFSPANVMKLLEVVRGRATSRQVIATSLKLAKDLGKVGVVVGNCFGFVANRMLAYYMREAYLLLEEGASVTQIDNALIDFGLPVGPFGMQDIAGIDVGWRIRQHLKSVGKTRAEGPQSSVPDRLYEMGRYGQKTGAGWYRYETGSRTRIHDPVVDDVAAEEAAKRGVTRRAVSDADIIARIMTALANEGARVLEEGFAIRAGDIDVVYVNGFGYPRRRGGPMFYADTVGLPVVLARVNEYRRRFGEYWRPAPLLETLANEGGSFYGDAA